MKYMNKGDRNSSLCATENDLFFSLHVLVCHDDWVCQLPIYMCGNNKNKSYE